MRSHRLHYLILATVSVFRRQLRIIGWSSLKLVRFSLVRSRSIRRRSGNTVQITGFNISVSILYYILRAAIGMPAIWMIRVNLYERPALIVGVGPMRRCMVVVLIVVFLRIPPLRCRSVFGISGCRCFFDMLGATEINQNKIQYPSSTYISSVSRRGI